MAIDATEFNVTDPFGQWQICQKDYQFWQYNGWKFVSSDIRGKLIGPDVEIKNHQTRKLNRR